MRYSIEPREIRYVKDYGFLSFAKNIGKNISNKYGKKIVHTAKKFAPNALEHQQEQYKKQQKQQKI